MGRPHEKRIGFAIFLVAALAILFAWAVAPGEWTRQQNSGRDYGLVYEPVAQNLAAGRGLTLGDGSPATIYPPGYSLLLAGLIRLSSWSGVAFETFVAGFTLFSCALTAVLLFRLGSRTLNLWTGVIAAVLWITYPPALWLSRQPTSDTTFLPVFLAALLAFVPLLLGTSSTTSRAAAAGMLLGAAVLIRPIALFLVPLLALALLLRGRGDGWSSRARLAVVLLASYLAVLAPWEVWARNATGRWILVSTNGPASVIDGLTFAIRPTGYRPYVPVEPGIRQVMEDVLDSQAQGELRTMGQVAAFLTEALRDRPADLLGLIGWKAARSWYGTDSMRREETSIAGMHAIYLAFMIAGAVLLWREGGRTRKWVVLSGLVVAYYWGLTVVALSIARYMLPAFAVMFTWQASALELSWRRFRGQRAGAPSPSP